MHGTDAHPLNPVSVYLSAVPRPPRPRSHAYGGGPVSVGLADAVDTVICKLGQY